MGTVLTDSGEGHQFKPAPGAPIIEISELEKSLRKHTDEDVGFSPSG